MRKFQFLNRTNRCSDPKTVHIESEGEMFQFLNRTNRCSDIDEFSYTHNRLIQFQFLNRTNRCSDDSARCRRKPSVPCFNSSIGLTAVLTVSGPSRPLLSIQFQFLNRTNRCSDASSKAMHKRTSLSFQFLNRTNRCSDVNSRYCAIG